MLTQKEKLDVTSGSLRMLESQLHALPLSAHIMEEVSKLSSAYDSHLKILF